MKMSSKKKRAIIGALASMMLTGGMIPAMAATTSVTQYVAFSKYGSDGTTDATSRALSGSGFKLASYRSNYWGSGYYDENNSYLGSSLPSGYYTNDGSTITVNDNGTTKVYNLDSNNYWVRDGYTVTSTSNNALTPLTNTGKDVTYDVQWVGEEGKAPSDVLTSVQSVASASSTITNVGETLQKIDASTYAGVSNSGGTKVDGTWNYIVYDSSWQGVVDSSNYKNGYADLYTGSGKPRGFVTTSTTGSKLTFNETTQSYEYGGKTVDYSNVYVIDGDIGVFTNADGSSVYTGNVYGKNNEILMTVKDGDEFYSYWAASVTDPSATMATYRVTEYEKDLNTLKSNDDMLYHNDIKKVELAAGENNSGTITLYRNGIDGEVAVDNAITVTAGGGTASDGTVANNDTYVKVASGDTTVTLPTGSKVTGNDTSNLTKLTINGTEYTITPGKTYTGTGNVTVDNDTNTISAKDTYVTDLTISEKGTDGKQTITLKQNEGQTDKTITITDNDTHANVKSASLNGTKLTITDTDDASAEVDLSSIDTDTHATLKSASLNGSKLTITDTDNASVDVDLSGITTGLSSTDYRLVKNAKSDSGNYTVDKNGKVELTVQDANDATKTDTVTIDGIAVVYDGQGAGEGNLISTNSNGSTDYLGKSIVLGEDAASMGLYTTVVGTESSVTKADATTPYQGAFSTISGALNNIRSTTTGGDKAYSGIANDVSGSVNIVEDSNGVVIQGTGNYVKNAYDYMDVDPAELKAAYAQGGDALTAYLKDKKSGAVAVIGGANNVSDTTSTTAIGFGNTISKSKDVFTAGTGNTLDTVTNSVVLGNDTKIAKGVSGVISLGDGNDVDVSNSVAIGQRAKVAEAAGEGAVAIGSDSVADTAAGKVGYLAEEGETSPVWVSNNGAVSVGAKGEFGYQTTRQITNVAAGTELTDAVNVAQLKKVEDQASKDAKAAKTVVKAGKNVSSVNENTKTADGNTEYTIDAYDTKVKGDSNVSVTGGDLDKDNIRTYNIKLANTVTIGEGDNTNPVKIDGTNGAITGLTNTTIDYEGFATEGEGKAATEEQLSAMKTSIENNAYKGWKVSTNGAEGVDVTTGATVDFSNTDGNIVIEQDGTNIKTKLAKDVKIEDSLKVGDELTVTDGNVVVDGNTWIQGATTINDGNATVMVNNGKVIMTDGNGTDADRIEMSGNGVIINGLTVDKKDADGNSQIHGVADGVDNNDAVNVSQLKASKTEVKTAEGEKNLTVTPKTDEDDKHPIYEVSMSRDLDVDSVTAGDNAFNKTGLTIGKEGTSQIIINQTTISMGNQQVHNVAKGTEGTDAVNVSQLNEKATELSNSDDRLVSGAGSGTLETYDKVTDDNKVNLRVEDSTGKGYDVTITDVAKASDIGDINDFKDGVKNKDGSTTTVVDAINNIDGRVTTIEGDITDIKVDINNIKGDITNLDNRVTNVETVAKKHTTAKNTDGNIDVTPGTNADGGIEYTINLNKDISADTITSTTINSTTVNTENAYVTNVDNSRGDSVINKNYFETNSKNIAPGEYSVENNQVTMTYVDGAGKAVDGTAVITNVASKTELDQTNQQVNYNTQNINNLYGDVNNLYGDVDKLSGRINRVGAGAAALAALHPLDFDPDDKWDFAAGFGNYRGANATAVGAYYRPNEDTMFSVGGAFGGGENMVNVGFSVKLGRGSNNVTTSKVAMAKELKDLRSTVVTQAAQIAALTAMVNQLIENTDAQPIESTSLVPDTERYEIVNVERDPEVEGLLPIERVRAIETDEAQAAAESDVAE